LPTDSHIKGRVVSTVVATNYSLLSVSDLFALGLGLDFGGALLLARGLLGGPAAFTHRLTQSRNTLSWANVRAAEDRANGVAGVIPLVIGFAIQAIAYVSVIGYGSGQTRGAWAAVIAAACAAAGFGATLVWYKVIYRRFVRQYLVELAHYDLGGNRNPSPDLAELMTYGKILGQDQLPGEDPSAYAIRVWGIG
jgi:hypothetical protein